MTRINCPNCGYLNSINLERCSFCRATLADALPKGTEFKPCTICSGTGMVHLEYIKGTADKNENQ